MPARNVRRSITGFSRRQSASQARGDTGRAAAGPGPCRSPPYRLGASLSERSAPGGSYRASSGGAGVGAVGEDGLQSEGSLPGDVDAQAATRSILRFEEQI